MSYPGRNTTRLLTVSNANASVTIPTTATILSASTSVVATDGITWAAGVTFIPVHGVWEWKLLLNVYATVSRTLTFYAESSLDGVTWTALADSGRRITVGIQSDGQIVMFGSVSVDRPCYLRSYLWASGACTAVTETVATGVSVLAMRFQMAGPQ